MTVHVSGHSLTVSDLVHEACLVGYTLHVLSPSFNVYPDHALRSGDLSVQVFVEMPFEIKSIESPSHKIKMKVNSLSP